MGQFNSFINAAYKAIKNADALLENENTPFNAMYKQYKTLQSFWFRAIEDASDFSSKRLEELCVDLEDVIQQCERWINENSPNNKQQRDLEKQE